MSIAIAMSRILFGAIALAIVPAGLAPAQAPSPVRVEIGDFAYLKPSVNARVGDTIEWVNKDIVDHTATEKQNLWNVSMATGKTARVVMKKAGTFEYYCRYHPNMVARVIVAGPRKK